jgi:hypothetical protein
MLFRNHFERRKEQEIMKSGSWRVGKYGVMHLAYSVGPVSKRSRPRFYFGVVLA